VKSRVLQTVGASRALRAPLAGYVPRRSFSLHVAKELATDRPACSKKWWCEAALQPQCAIDQRRLFVLVNLERTGGR